MVARNRLPVPALILLVMTAFPAAGLAQALQLDQALALLPPARAPTKPATPAWDGRTDQLLAGLLLGLYRNTLARTDLDACAFAPTCSHYAEQAIAQRGWLRGILAGADRLLRDHPGVGQLGYQQAPDGKHFLDPPEAPCSDCDVH